MKWLKSFCTFFSHKKKPKLSEKEQKLRDYFKGKIKVAKYKISLGEYLKNRVTFDSLSGEMQDNINDLMVKINTIRDKYDNPMIVSSGFRSKHDQIRIYAEKGITDINKIPMGSKHLSGQAIDIFDPSQKLQKWCKSNEDILEEVGFWIEDFSATKNWVHFQTKPPRSGKRYFYP